MDTLKKIKSKMDAAIENTWQSIAEKIAKNLRNNTDGNTWYLLNEAAENLGMSYMKASEMTQSDWDRINAEIARIR